MFLKELIKKNSDGWNKNISFGIQGQKVDKEIAFIELINKGV